MTADRSRWAPFALVVLSPVVAELLSGATKLSVVFALIPEIMVWGCGALLIREVAVRRGLRWPGVLLMGMALAVMEEFLIQQTSIAPMPWPSPAASFGRFGGVNWPYFLHMVGYEAVWVVLLPIALVNLLLPTARSRPWLRTPGLVINAVLFLLGSLIAWLLWTQIVRENVFHAPHYQPPLVLLATGCVAVLMLIWLALTYGTIQRPNDGHIHPWQAGLCALLASVPWWVLLVVVFVKTDLPPGLVIGLGTLWGFCALYAFLVIASRQNWNERCVWAIVLTGVCFSMAMGFLGASTWSPFDLWGKLVLNLIAVALLLALGRRVAARS